MKKRKMSFFQNLDEMASQIHVSEIMVHDIKTIKENDKVHNALEKMGKFSIAGLIVTDKEAYPIGIVSEGDIIRKVFLKNKNPKKIQVKDIMSGDLLTIEPNLKLGEVSVLMKKNNVSKLPVIENNKLVGYVTKSDLLEKMNELYYQNTRLRWFPIFLLIQFIVIVLLILAYVNK